MMATRDLNRRLMLLEDQVEKLHAKCKIQKGVFKLYKLKTQKDINRLREQEIEPLLRRIESLERGFVENSTAIGNRTGMSDMEVEDAGGIGGEVQNSVQQQTQCQDHGNPANPVSQNAVMEKPDESFGERSTSGSDTDDDLSQTSPGGETQNSIGIQNQDHINSSDPVTENDNQEKATPVKNLFNSKANTEDKAVVESETAANKTQNCSQLNDATVQVIPIPLTEDCPKKTALKRAARSASVTTDTESEVEKASNTISNSNVPSTNSVEKEGTDQFKPPNAVTPNGDKKGPLKNVGKGKKTANVKNIKSKAAVLPAYKTQSGSKQKDDDNDTSSSSSDEKEEPGKNVGQRSTSGSDTDELIQNSPGSKSKTQNSNRVQNQDPINPPDALLETDLRKKATPVKNLFKSKTNAKNTEDEGYVETVADETQNAEGVHGPDQVEVEPHPVTEDFPKKTAVKRVGRRSASVTTDAESEAETPTSKISNSKVQRPSSDSVEEQEIDQFKLPHAVTPNGNKKGPLKNAGKGKNKPNIKNTKTKAAVPPAYKTQNGSKQKEDDTSSSSSDDDDSDFEDGPNKRNMQPRVTLVRQPRWMDEERLELGKTKSKTRTPSPSPAAVTTKRNASVTNSATKSPKVSAKKSRPGF